MDLNLPAFDPGATLSTFISLATAFVLGSYNGEQVAEFDFDVIGGVLRSTQGRPPSWGGTAVSCRTVRLRPESGAGPLGVA